MTGEESADEMRAGAGVGAGDVAAIEEPCEVDGQEGTRLFKISSGTASSRQASHPLLSSARQVPVTPQHPLDGRNPCCPGIGIERRKVRVSEGTGHRVCASSRGGHRVESNHMDVEAVAADPGPRRACW